jgi:hypothetical protein
VAGPGVGRDPSGEDTHHAVPRCLLALHERANGGDGVGGELDGAAIQAWLEWEMEAMRWRVPVEISRADLEGLVEALEVVLGRERHRLVPSSDWRRWGSREGRETIRRFRLEVALATRGALSLHNRALGHGDRLFSAHETPHGRVWVITEADRSSTTVLLPEEY